MESVRRPHRVALTRVKQCAPAGRRAARPRRRMPSHGRRGVSAVMLGSETIKVLTHSKVPVVVVR